MEMASLEQLTLDAFREWTGALAAADYAFKAITGEGGGGAGFALVGTFSNLSGGNCKLEFILRNEPWHS